ncbi:MAG: hypothetical protein IPM70_07345 [Proteobacteria bacterium]|jgi:hypothetical protein|nr:hypothetical protein [Pseudomonadota bacterium]MBK7116113.1 hypothetical protein [Pseudomonadota bacterium]MBK9251718.1 hypothetical protein [Pseudomonadota bacterium]MCC6631020.1 hypothetical protein [Gammaproteobacteria bacterium]
MAIRSLFVCCALWGATMASAAEPAFQQPSGKALMLYINKPVSSGLWTRREPLSFGLRLQQSPARSFMRPVALLDWNYALGGRRSFSSAGILMFDSAGSVRRHPELAALAAAAAAAGLACAAGWGICDGGSSDETYTPPGE